MSNPEENQPEATEEKQEEAAEEKQEEAAEENPAEDEEESESKKNQKKDKKSKRKQKEDDSPDFERVEDHHFEKDEKVYMIDPNGFDLWEGVVEKVEGEDKYSIHYPDFPEDDEVVEGTSRILVKTEKNTEIYNKQEEVRRIKEEEDVNEGEDDEDDEDAEEKPKKKGSKK